MRLASASTRLCLLCRNKLTTLALLKQHRKAIGCNQCCSICSTCGLPASMDLLLS